MVNQNASSAAIDFERGIKEIFENAGFQEKPEGYKAPKSPTSRWGTPEFKAPKDGRRDTSHDYISLPQWIYGNYKWSVQMDKESADYGKIIGLDSHEALYMQTVMTYKFHDEADPFPSIDKISGLMNIERRTGQRTKQKFIKNGWMVCTSQGGRKGDIQDFEPLIRQFEAWQRFWLFIEDEMKSFKHTQMSAPSYLKESQKEDCHKNGFVPFHVIQRFVERFILQVVKHPIDAFLEDSMKDYLGGQYVNPDEEDDANYVTSVSKDMRLWVTPVTRRGDAHDTFGATPASPEVYNIRNKEKDKKSAANFSNSGALETPFFSSQEKTEIAGSTDSFDNDDNGGNDSKAQELKTPKKPKIEIRKTENMGKANGVNDVENPHYAKDKDSAPVVTKKDWVRQAVQELVRIFTKDEKFIYLPNRSNNKPYAAYMKVAGELYDFSRSQTMSDGEYFEPSDIRAFYQYLTDVKLPRANFGIHAMSKYYVDFALSRPQKDTGGNTERMVGGVSLDEFLKGF